MTDTMILDRSFDPKKYLMKLQGKDYLPVQARVLWLRTKHPDAQIMTEVLEHRVNEYAMIRATIIIPGLGSATGHGSEDPKGFRDYIEKAETKAIGRALGLLGFGTQFTDDFDTPVSTNGDMRIVDSPIERKTENIAKFVPKPEPERSIEDIPTTRTTVTHGAPATDDRNIRLLLRAEGERLGVEVMQQQSQEMFGVSSSSKLTPDQCKELYAWAVKQD